jgi:hypothetical protein
MSDTAQVDRPHALVAAKGTLAYDAHVLGDDDVLIVTAVGD